MARLLSATAFSGYRDWLRVLSNATDKIIHAGCCSFADGAANFKGSADFIGGDAEPGRIAQVSFDAGLAICCTDAPSAISFLVFSSPFMVRLLSGCLNV